VVIDKKSRAIFRPIILFVEKGTGNKGSFKGIQNMWMLADVAVCIHIFLFTTRQMRSCLNVNIITILIFPVATATPSAPTPTTKPARLLVCYFFMAETNEKRPCLLGTTLRTFHLNHLIFNINDDHVIFPVFQGPINKV
jgi:hypothetical protein